MNAPDTAAAIRQQADSLELGAATLRLWQYLFRGSRPPVRAGRLRFLTSMIESRPALRHALRPAGDERMLTREWAETLAVGAADVRFLHGLAVVYREQALESRRAGSIREAYEVTSTALWGLLFGADAFWESVDATSDVELAGECIESILVPHADAGRRHLASRRPGHARVHLRCLDVCRKGHRSLLEALAGYGLAFDLPVDAARLGRVQARAAALVEDWSRAITGGAERAANDPDALARLPEAIRKDYQAALAVVDEFLSWGIAEAGVLTAALGWYNDWCFDLYVAERRAELTTVVGRARGIAERLAPLAERHHGFRPEEEVLSQHFLISGVAADDRSEAMAQFEEALSWDATNRTAARLLHELEADVRRGQLRTAIDAADWPEAYRIVESAQSASGDGGSDETVGLQSILWFEHAKALRDAGQTAEALELARTALDAVPSHALIGMLVTELERQAAGSGAGLP